MPGRAKPSVCPPSRSVSLTTHSVHLVVLSKKEPSPLIPQPQAAPGDAARQETSFRIDLKISRKRILRLPIPVRTMQAGGRQAGHPLLLEAGWTPLLAEGGSQTLHRFDLKSRKSEKWIEGLGGFALSYTAAKYCIRRRTPG
jgi:hypothetical protein